MSFLSSRWLWCGACARCLAVAIDGVTGMIDRLIWRVQPVKHILKRDERHKDMMNRHRQEKFAELLIAEKKKLKERESND